jgi:hypothetical protein
MRKWVKYFHDRSIKGKVCNEKSSTPEDHARDMGGYHSDASYKDKEFFFAKWYHNQQDGRLETYNRFVQSNLDKKVRILSLASGRCAGEIYLLAQGHDIVCSDLRELDIHDDARKLFPLFRFFLLDILRSSLQKKYDAITAFSLLYLFSDNDLKVFFRNVSSSLNDDGVLILDPGGASDNRVTLFMDEFFLKYEVCLIRAILFALSKSSALVVKHHGFRRSDDEIIAAAKEAGFELVATEDGDFLTEFRRSRILGYLLRKSNIARKIISAIGRKIPYIRLFAFRRFGRERL